MPPAPYLKHKKQVCMPSQQKGTFSGFYYYYFLYSLHCGKGHSNNCLPSLRNNKYSMTTVLVFCEGKKKIAGIR